MSQLGYRISDMTNEKIREIKADPRQFDLFIKRNKGFLNQITLKFAKKHDSHYEDLYQIACIGLFKALDGFDEKRKDASKLSTYAWKCIVNDLIQEIKRMNKTRAYEHSMENWTTLDHVPGGATDVHEYYEAKWKPIHRRHVNMEDEIVNKIAKEQLLTKFSQTERDIILLKQDGYKMNEIAKLLRKNIHTVRSMYFYATKKPEFREMVLG